MARLTKDKTALEAARVEYIKSTKALNDVAREFGLKPLNFRAYLRDRNEIKSEHKNPKKLAIQRAVDAIVEVDKVPMPPAMRDFFGNSLAKFENFKGNGIDHAIYAVGELNKALQDFDGSPKEKVALIAQAANAFKAYSDALGAYPKAPTIAIQNNLQQNLNNNQQKQSKDNALRVEIVEVDDK